MNEKGFGLLPTPQDNRDFPFGALFDRPKIDDVPQNIDWFVSKPLAIKDQKESDFCPAFAVSSVSEDQEGVLLDPYWQFAKIKQLSGDIEKWGADLRTSCKSVVKFGSILFYKPQYDINFDFVRDYKNWPKKYDKEAEEHKKQSYFYVDGNYDIFDNFRTTLWANLNEKRSIFTGAMWRKSWIYAESGIIQKEYEKNGFGHAFKIFGQKIINGEPFLVAQLSNGEKIGDKGIFYFSREIINKEFTFGAYTFKDLPAENAKYMLDRGIRFQEGILNALFKKVKYFILG